MSDEFGDFIRHYGVKGMKWGVRKDRGHEGQRAKTKKIAKLDAKYERKADDPRTVIAIYNNAVPKANARVDAINNNPAYRGMDFTRDSPLRERYYREHQENMLAALRESAQEFGTNASGTREFVIVEARNGEGWDISTREVRHAMITSHVSWVLDDQGFILRYVFDKPLEQSDIVGEFLAHYGVKGMKWGVRRQRRVERARRVANRQGSLRDKASTAYNVRTTDLLARRSFSGAADRYATREENREARFQAGEATARDILARFGTSVTLHNEDFIPVRRRRSDG